MRSWQYRLGALIWDFGRRNIGGGVDGQTCLYFLPRYPEPAIARLDEVGGDLFRCFKGYAISPIYRRRSSSHDKLHVANVRFYLG
ncbi:MAG TPA: hypothetical protein VK395_32145 [Gemmataceae bacterium]|nr:hypothetical protein [Gemmataceae bacterium]